MNALLNRAFIKASQLTSEEQSVLGITFLSLIEEPFLVDSLSKAAISEGLEQAKSGDVLSLEEMKVIRAQYKQ